VATNDIHYARRDQAEAHDVLLCIGTGKTVNEANRLRMTDPSYYMRSPQEMEKLYRHLPDALLNTVKIAEQCEVKLAFAPPYHLPKFPVPPDKGTSEEYVRALCRQGMQWRYGNDATRPDYVERLEYELSVIHSMGFDDYFPHRVGFVSGRAAHGHLVECPRLRRGQRGGVLPGHHQRRPLQEPADVRALPQPRPDFHARH
jgi:DNA polymerase-3 subunit alpha